MAYLRKPSEQQDETPDRIMAGYGSSAQTAAQPGANSQVGGMASPGPAPQQPQPYSPSPDTGPSGSGYINFERIFNANADSAQKTAQKTAADIAGKADAAKSALGQVQNQFESAAQRGTVKAPDKGAQDYFNTGKVPGPVTSQSAMQSQAAGQLAQRQPAPNTLRKPTAADYESQAKYAANNGYSGPSALDVMSGYGDALQKGHAAYDALQATQTQGGLQGLLQSESQGAPGGYSDNQSAFDAALVGRAGGQQFANERNQYGNLEKLFNDAQNAASGRAAEAGSNSAANAAQWGALQNAQAQRQNQKPVDTSIHLGAAPSTLGTVPGVDPNQAIGGPQQWGQMYNDFGFKTDKDGRLSGDDKDTVMKVLDGITPQEEAALANMTAAERKAWFEARRKQKGL